MSNSDKSTDTQNSHVSDSSTPTAPHGYKQYIILTKKPPKAKKGQIVLHREITENTPVDNIINDLHELHQELNKVVCTSKKIYVDCSGCFSNCLKTKVKAHDNNVSII